MITDKQMDLSLNQYINPGERVGTVNAQNTVQDSDLAQPVVASRTIGTTELSIYEGADAASMVLSPGFKQINNPVYSQHEAKMVHYVESDPTHESRVGSGIASVSPAMGPPKIIRVNQVEA